MNLLILLVIVIGTKAAAIYNNDNLDQEAVQSSDMAEEELARSVRDLIYWNRVYNQLKSESIQQFWNLQILTHLFQAAEAHAEWTWSVKSTGTTLIKA